MRFWDTSAIVPLLIDEPERAAVLGAFEFDPMVVTWWGTGVECASAIARQQRDEVLDRRDFERALSRLDALAASWQEIEPTDHLRRSAIRMLRVHALRAGDALQLAAALRAAEDHPASLPFVTYDNRLAHAATREGFPVVSPGR